MDHAGDLGDDYKFGQDQVFQDSSHHNYKMIKASVLSGPDLKHNLQRGLRLDSAAVSIIVVILVELTNTVFVNSTNITTNIETAALFSTVCSTEL